MKTTRKGYFTRQKMQNRNVAAGSPCCANGAAEAGAGGLQAASHVSANDDTVVSFVGLQG